MRCTYMCGKSQRFSEQMLCVDLYLTFTDENVMLHEELDLHGAADAAAHVSAFGALAVAQCWEVQNQ